MLRFVILKYLQLESHQNLFKFLVNIAANVTTLKWSAECETTTISVFSQVGDSSDTFMILTSVTDGSAVGCDTVSGSCQCFEGTVILQNVRNYLRSDMV